MKEYIERAVAVQELEVLRQEYEMHDDCDELVARRCRDALSAVPAADVAEVRHGRWEDKTNISRAEVEQRVDCSVCGQIFWTTAVLSFNYCPNCGARMDKEDNYVRND